MNKLHGFFWAMFFVFFSTTKKLFIRYHRYFITKCFKLDPDPPCLQISEAVNIPWLGRSSPPPGSCPPRPRWARWRPPAWWRTCRIRTHRPTSRSCRPCTDGPRWPLHRGWPCRRRKNCEFAKNRILNLRSEHLSMLFMFTVKNITGFGYFLSFKILG